MTDIALTIHGIMDACRKQIELLGDNSQVTLKQSGRWGKTDYRKLLGVKGKIVQDNFGDGMVVVYPAKELLDALNKAMEDGTPL